MDDDEKRTTIPASPRYEAWYIHDYENYSKVNCERIVAFEIITTAYHDREVNPVTVSGKVLTWKEPYWFITDNNIIVGGPYAFSVHGARHRTPIDPDDRQYIERLLGFKRRET